MHAVLWLSWCVAAHAAPETLLSERLRRAEVFEKELEELGKHKVPGKVNLDFEVNTRDITKEASQRRRRRREEVSQGKERALSFVASARHERRRRRSREVAALREDSIELSRPAAFAADREMAAGTRLAAETCESPVDLDDLNLGIRLVSEFLVRSQQPAGNFRYEYDWLSHSENNDVSPVRQAGTLWGLSLLHVDDAKLGLMPNIRKGLQYFKKNSVEFPGGVRMMAYPGQKNQKIGSVALLALSHIEVLRRPEALESAAEKQELKAHLAGYLRAILGALNSKHRFHRSYHGDTGKHYGPTTPFYDGECLLALVKAAKYLGHDYLWPHIKKAAEAGWREIIMHGKRITTGEGYYHWAAMAWYELMGTHDHPEFAKYGHRLLLYTDHVLDRRLVLNRSIAAHNFEGLIPGYVTAVHQGDPKMEKRLACVIRKGMQPLHSLQVGHPKAYGLGGPNATAGQVGLHEDERAQGGVQFTRNATALRIDTAQHHLHALLLARRLVQQQALI